jgi:hypothetical protein
VSPDFTGGVERNFLTFVRVADGLAMSDDAVPPFPLPASADRKSLETSMREELEVGPDSYCSPRHTSNSSHKTLSCMSPYDVVSNICQALARGELEGTPQDAEGDTECPRGGREVHASHVERHGRGGCESKHTSDVELTSRVRASV